MKPKIIVFDYGQTLVNEYSFNASLGTKAVLKNCANIKEKELCQNIDILAKEISFDIRAYKNVDIKHSFLEIHHHQIQNYLYEYFGVTMNCDQYEVEKVFWEYSTPGERTENIIKLFNYLKNNNINIAVASNISFSRTTMKNRLKQYFPTIDFDFIITSADFIFRKPHYRFFDMVIRKTNLLFENEISTSDIWYCGDKPVWDIDGASAVGITPIWYTGHLEKDNQTLPICKHIQIADWCELIEVLENHQ